MFRYLNKNQLSGTIPSELGVLTKLKHWFVTFYKILFFLEINFVFL